MRVRGNPSWDYDVRRVEAVCFQDGVSGAVGIQAAVVEGEKDGLGRKVLRVPALEGHVLFNSQGMEACQFQCSHLLREQRP